MQFLFPVFQNVNGEEVVNNAEEVDSEGEEVVYRSKKVLPQTDKATAADEDGSRVNDQRHVAPASKSTLVL